MISIGSVVSSQQKHSSIKLPYLWPSIWHAFQIHDTCELNYGGIW
jgi:hypothetical protein